MTSPRSYLLDSTFVIDFLKGKEYAYTFFQTVLAKQHAHQPAGTPQPSLHISMITYAEVYQGIFYGNAPEQAEQAFLDCIRYLNVDTITRSIAKTFARIRGDLQAHTQIKHLVHPKDNYDLFIAATALHYQLILVTNNVKDYERIPQLTLYPLP